MKPLDSAQLRIFIVAVLMATSVFTVPLVLSWGADLVQNYRPRNPVTGGAQIVIYYSN